MEEGLALAKREVTSLQWLVGQRDGLALSFLLFSLVSVLRLNTCEAGFLSLEDWFVSSWSSHLGCGLGKLQIPIIVWPDLCSADISAQLPAAAFKLTNTLREKRCPIWCFLPFFPVLNIGLTNLSPLGSFQISSSNFFSLYLAILREMFDLIQLVN